MQNQKPAISRDGPLPSSKKSNALLALLVTVNSRAVPNTGLERAIRQNKNSYANYSSEYEYE